MRQKGGSVDVHRWGALPSGIAQDIESVDDAVRLSPFLSLLLEGGASFLGRAALVVAT